VQGFGRREYQLVLLRRMADFQPELVAGALGRIGATPTDLRAAHRRWQSMLRSARFPRDVQRYAAVLGTPDSERTVQVGDAECISRAWALAELWPELQWEVFTDRAGLVLNEWLIRRAGSPVDLPSDVAALTPWSCVVGDLAAAYPDARHSDPGIPSRWLVEMAGPHSSHRATFVWGLLQKVEPC
jgi:PIN domain nuclease of toxin-antitoxin system